MCVSCTNLTLIKDSSFLTVVGLKKRNQEVGSIKEIMTLAPSNCAQTTVDYPVVDTLCKAFEQSAFKYWKNQISSLNFYY